jgi:hypothetical protein
MLLSANEGAVSLSQLGTQAVNFRAREIWCKIILLISVLYKFIIIYYYFRSEANTLDRKKIIESKRTH